MPAVGSSESWSNHAQDYDQIAQGFIAPIAAQHFAMISGLEPKNVLDVACGTGMMTMKAAERWPSAEILATDYAPGMVEIMSERAKTSGWKNVRGEVVDAQDMVNVPSASQDLVMCSMGIMLMGEPDRAVAEFLRVLRPGGTAAASTWVKMEQTKYIIEALHVCLGKPQPDQSAGWVPGADWSNAEYIRDRFLATGFTSAQASVVEGAFEITDFASWSKIATTSNPGFTQLADSFNLSPEQRAKYPQMLHEVLSRHFPEGKARLSCVANIVVATK